MTRSWRLLAAALACAAVGLLLAEAAYRGLLSRKEAGAPPAFDLYAVGESSTYGQPYGPELAFPRLTARMFGDRLGGLPIVVHNLGRPGDTIYPQALALARALRFRDKTHPAAVLIYSGHNEYFQNAEDRPGPARALARFKRGVIYRSFLLSDLFEAVERRYALEDVRDLEAYDFNFRRIVAESRDAGAAAIVSSVIGNESGVEPNADCKGPTQESCAASLAALERGRALEKKGSAAAARSVYAEAAREAGGMAALLRFKAARLAQGQGDYDEAWRLYHRAIDDSPPGQFGRATTSLNERMRRLAGEEGVPFVDAVALFEANSPHGIVGDELMADGHHPNLKGYLLLAGAFAEELGRLRNEPPTVRLDPEAAFRQAAFGPERRALSLTQSGLWLLVVSLDHPSPEGRLALAEGSFREAARLDPEASASSLGLALTLGARRKGRLSGEPYNSAVRALVSTPPCSPPDEALLAVLALDHVPPALLASYRRARLAECRPVERL